MHLKRFFVKRTQQAFRCRQRVKRCVTRYDLEPLVHRELCHSDAVYGRLPHKFIAPAQQNVGTADDELLHDRAGAAIISGITEACRLRNAEIGAAQNLLRALTAPR